MNYVVVVAELFCFERSNIYHLHKLYSIVLLLYFYFYSNLVFYVYIRKHKTIIYIKEQYLYIVYIYLCVVC